MIFDRLIKIPGEATHAALKRLEQIPDFPIRPDWMRIHALRRAEGDAVLPPWAPEDVMTFERTLDHPPITTADLQLLARRRIEDIQHDLINGKFTQGDTLQLLPDENSVQRWIATQFEARQKEAYTVQRETHYADDKEPDITLISRHSGVELPIEIKVADGMSIKELEAALVTQLCGQYLRHAPTRHGILLLVHQQAREVGGCLKTARRSSPMKRCSSGCTISLAPSASNRPWARSHSSKPATFPELFHRARRSGRHAPSGVLLTARNPPVSRR